MRSIKAKWVIIGIVLCILSGCSTIRLSYNHGPALVTWWLDDYLDLDATQQDRLRPEVERWFAWHRRTQLPVYMRQLAQWRGRAAGPVTPDEICAGVELTRQRLLEALDQGVPAAAQLLPLVRPAQWDHMAQHLADRQAKWRKEFLQPRREDRIDALVKRAVDRAETLYGPLTAPERSLLAKAAADSPFDPERWGAERERRHQALVQVLRRLTADPSLALERRIEALRGVLHGYMQSPDPEFAERESRWQAYNCQMAARLHALISPAQRDHLQQRLADWETDLRALAAESGAP